MAPPAAAEKVVVLPAELARFLEDGQLIVVATRTDDLEPECMDATALRVEGEPGVVAIYVPAALAGPTLANLRSNGQIAVGIGRPTDHRTYQLKGVFVDDRPAGEEERQLQLDYLEKVTRQLGLVGVPQSVCRRIVWWPSHVVRFAVRDIFEQTPGPGAGRRFDPAAPAP
jgi:hypothetical protein